LFLENPILFDQVDDHAALPAVDPGGEGRQQQSKLDDFDHRERVSDSGQPAA
jgi:hypothetical protein